VKPAALHPESKNLKKTPFFIFLRVASVLGSFIAMNHTDLGKA
jgi:hypothetical protein